MTLKKSVPYHSLLKDNFKTKRIKYPLDIVNGAHGSLENKTMLFWKVKMQRKNVSSEITILVILRRLI